MNYGIKYEIMNSREENSSRQCRNKIIGEHKEVHKECVNEAIKGRKTSNNESDNEIITGVTERKNKIKCKKKHHSGTIRLFSNLILMIVPEESGYTVPEV